MQERTTSSEFIFEIGQSAATGAAIFIILAANSERDAVSFGDYNGRRPDFDIELGNRAGLKRLLLIM